MGYIYASKLATALEMENILKEAGVEYNNPFIFTYWNVLDEESIDILPELIIDISRYSNYYLFNEKDEIKDFNNLKECKTIAIVKELVNENSYESCSWKIFETISDFIKEKEQLENYLEFHLFYLNDDILQETLDKIIDNINKKEEKRMQKVHFKGDIIITDPCYIINKKLEEQGKPKFKDYISHEDIKDYDDYNEHLMESKKYYEEYSKYRKAMNEWEMSAINFFDKTNGYDDFSILGFSSFLSHNTLYGDWSCTTFNSNTKEVLGEFCADSGMVGVFLLDEVLKHNPSFNYHIERPWTTTLIKDFDGDIQFIKKDEQTLIVKGIGNINFETAQTGF